MSLSGLSGLDRMAFFLQNEHRSLGKSLRGVLEPKTPGLLISGEEHVLEIEVLTRN
ncbi:MAG: hypothetical protein MSH32_10675 [Lachnospiraceae bacterium]|nr:hypothetical protein [Lachnospiraceae bacterium]